MQTSITQSELNVNVQSNQGKAEYQRSIQQAAQIRALAEAEAEKIVVEGFFDPIFQRIPFEGVRERFQQYIADKMA